MKRIVLPFVALMIAAVCAAAFAAEEKTEKSLKETLAELLPGMGAEKIPDRQKPQQQWQKICFESGTPGKEAQRAEVCRLMIEKIGPATPNPARIWLLKQLEFSGRGECVDAAAKLLDDPDKNIRDSARRCLANNPDPKATAALLEKLRTTTDKDLKVALLHALAFRADKAATEGAAKELGSADEAVVAAAARALGKLATPEAAQALAAARPNARGDARLRISDAYKGCADALVKAGKADEAMAIYKELAKPDESRPIRLAALVGMLNASGDQAGNMVLQLLAGEDKDARAIAAGHLPNLSEGGVKTLIAGISKLPALGQTALLTALAARGDQAAMPAALVAAKSADETLKLAGLRALGSVGDASVVPLLIEAMAAAGSVGGAARDSLVAVHGKGTDEAIVAALQAEKDLRKRAELIGILEARRAFVATPVLLEEALHADAAIRRRAMSALGKLAAPKDIPGMVKALLKAEKGSERDDAEKAILAVCQQVPKKEEQADPVLSAVASAGDAEKAAVLPLLGRLGGAKARELVAAALKSENAEHYDAGVRALCNWPDASVAEQLLDLFQSGKAAPQRVAALRALVRVTTPTGDPPREGTAPVLRKALEPVRAALDDKTPEIKDAALRALADWPSSAAAPDLLKLAQAPKKDARSILALRGYVRLAGLVAGRSGTEGVKMYQEAIEVAKRPDEKKQILSGLAAVKSLDALKLAEPCLKDAPVKAEAIEAVITIAGNLRGAHPDESKAALEEVLSLTQDKRIRDRVGDLLQGKRPAKRRK